MSHDKQTGFIIKTIGFHPADKVTDFAWSSGGGIFCICEKEGNLINCKNIWSFYLIVRHECEAENKREPIEMLRPGQKVKTNQKKNMQ